MTYQVFDNGMPADTTVNGSCRKMSKGIGWDNSKFPTREEAISYALNYLGPYRPSYNESINWDKYVYSSAGDYLQIKEIK